MPRHSPYEIVLSKKEAREQAAMTRKYTLSYFQVQRAKMVLLAAQGLANKVIAERLDTRREVVCFWRKRFFDQRLVGLDDRDRSARPRSFPPRGRRPGKSAGL